MNKLNFTFTKFCTGLILLLAGLFWQTNLLAQCAPTPGFPNAPASCAQANAIFTEDFNTSSFGVFTEDSPPGPGTTGANDLTVSTNSDTPSSGTGPECTAIGIISTNEEFIFLESSNAATGETHCMTTTVDLTAQVPGLELSFWYYLFGSNIGELTINVNGAPVFTSCPGQIQTGQFDPWLQGSANLDAFAGQMITLQVCMTEGIGASTFQGDISIDHIQIFACSPPQVANDDIANAIPVTCGSVTPGTTVSASPDGTAFCGTSNTAPGVWYSFLGNGNIVTASTCSPNTNYDTKLTVYEGGNGCLTCVDGNDDDFGCGNSILQSSVTFCSVPGTTYQILVHGFGTGTGNFDLSLTCTPSNVSLTCPPPVTVEGCTAADAAPYATLADLEAAGGSSTDADPNSLIVLNETSSGTCPVIVIRTYQVADDCGNTATCDQTITVEDTTPPDILPGGSGVPPTPPVCADYFVDNSLAINYFPINIPANFVGNGDDVTFDVPLGAPFPLYGTPVGTLQASTNGWLTDNLAAGSDLGNSCPYPDGSTSGGILGLMHDDLDMDPNTPNSGIYYQYFPISPVPHPNGFAMGASIFEWTGEHFPGGAGGIDVVIQAILYETGDVIYQYLSDPENGSGATLGAFSSTCPSATTIACNSAGTTTGNAYGLSPYGGPLATTPTPDIPPSVVECDGAGNVNDLANWLATNGGNVASDLCGGAVTWTNNFSGLSNDCGATGSATVIFTATDECGNAASMPVTFIIEDTTAPAITCPPSLTLTCFENSLAVNTAADFIAAGGTISDDCTESLADFTVFSQNDDNGGDNCPGNARVITRTYFVLDACGNSSTCTQTITYLASTVGPVITSILPTCFKYCGELANPMESDITYTTDCNFGAVVTITGPTVIGPENCPGTIYRYSYTVTDDCGRVSAAATRDFVIDNEGPTIECPSFNLLLECGDANNSTYIDNHFALVTANTSCELGYTITHFPSNFNNITCNTSTTVTFTATDACGRTATCTTVVNISDNTAPVITSTYIDGICNEAVCGSNLSFWYNNWKAKVLEGLSATDACDSNVSFSTQGPSSPASNCPDETTETVLTWVANDNCGNTSTIQYSFYVTAADPPAPPQTSSITGMIHTEVMDAVEDVEVTLTGGASFFEMMVTANNGMYNFENVPLEQNYQITPLLDQNPLNGVSSFDLVLITQHILSMNQLDSPYKMIAADINKSGEISTLDIVELRKMILYINTEFPDNTSWRFVEADYVFPYPTNPFATAFPEVVDINGLLESAEHDFVGVKIGDVNGSAVPNNLTGADDRSFNGDLHFDVNDQLMTEGETYEVVFSSADFKAIAGYQYTLNFDTELLEFVNVNAGELAGMSEANFGLSLLESGAITTSWNSNRPVSMKEDAELFRITLKAKQATQLSAALYINSRYTTAEAYDVRTENGQLNLLNVDLRFNDLLTGEQPFALLQNTPNPFRDETVIGFILPEATTATMTIYDVSGKQLKQVSGNFEAGYNEFSLDRSELVEGMLYYELVTATDRATKKMMLMNK